jgi:hypothetical protein
VDLKRLEVILFLVGGMYIILLVHDICDELLYDLRRSMLWVVLEGL